MSDATDRLARTRLAVVEYVELRDAALGSQEADGRPAQGGRTAAGWFMRARAALRAWWRFHPVHLGLELAKPALSRYAGEKPLQFVGIAAALGAAVALVRPWRLISLSGALVAIAKSSQWSGALLAMLAGAEAPQDRDADESART